MTAAPGTDSSAAELGQALLSVGLDDLRADLAQAERALRDLELSDDHAHTSGAWDRAHGLVLRIRREIADAERVAA